MGQRRADNSTRVPKFAPEGYKVHSVHQVCWVSWYYHGCGEVYPAEKRKWEAILSSL